MFLMYFHNKFHMPSSNSSLAPANKPKGTICLASLLPFYVLQLYKSFIIFSRVAIHNFITLNWWYSRRLLSRIWVEVMLRPTVSRLSVLVPGTHLGPTTTFVLLSDSCRFVDVGRPLWWGEESSLQMQLCLASTVILGSECLRTHYNIPLSQIWKSPYLEGQVPRIYAPKEQDGPVIHQGIGFPFRRLLRLVELRWR
jgi:hypothetical protein